MTASNNSSKEESSNTSKETTTTTTTTTPPMDDPHFWLEEVLGEKQLAWVEAKNKICIDHVGDPKGTPTFERIKSILEYVLHTNTHSAVNLRRCCFYKSVSHFAIL